MRVSLLALTAFAALALAACDGRRAPPPTAAPPAPGPVKSDADCCCVKQCQDAPKDVAEAHPPAPPPVSATGGDGQGKVYRKTWRKGGGGYRGEYRRRTGTEGVGYLDEGYAGGRYAGGGSVRYEERYSETERRSETYEERRYGGGGYAYAEGGYGYAEGDYGYREGGGRRGGKGGKKRRNYDRSYVGADRDGYLTWPGKTP